MTSLTFTALDIVAEPYAAAPQLTARLRIVHFSALGDGVNRTSSHAR